MNFKDIIGPDELDWKVIPLDWKKIGKDELKLGTPMSKDGLEANDASCYGILMDDAEKGKHFQARVIVSGCVDFDKAEEYSGVKISEEAKNAIGKVWSQAGGGLAELPDGVPYVETIYDEWGTVTVVADAESSSCEVTFYDNEGSIRVIEAGKKYRAIFDGKEYICTGADKSLYTWFSADGSNVVSETCPFYFKTAESAANHRKLSVYEAGQHTFSVAEIVEEVHPVDMRCLPEGYPYKEQSETVVLEEQAVEFADQGGQLLGGLNEALFVSGNTYKIIWDGTAYVCTATEIQGTIAIGNLSNVGGTGNNEPFMMMVTGGTTTIVALEGGAEHTVSISEYSETIHPMAPEFLPAGLGGGYVLELNPGDYSQDSSGFIIDDVSYDPLYEAISQGQHAVIKLTMEQDGNTQTSFVAVIYSELRAGGLYCYARMNDFDMAFKFYNGSYHSA